MSEKCSDRIFSALESRAEDFTAFMNGQTPGPEEDYGDFMEQFCNYGLSFDSEKDEFGNVEYYIYQLSWGGPSDEVRFHADGKITYHFMDWFDGAHKDVTKEDWAQWLKDEFTELGMIRFGD